MMADVRSDEELMHAYLSGEKAAICSGCIDANAKLLSDAKAVELIALIAAIGSATIFSILNAPI